MYLNDKVTGNILSSEDILQPPSRLIKEWFNESIWEKQVTFVLDCGVMVNLSSQQW
jgi:hypothetical protein